jgi:phosphoribulokinase
MGLLTLLTTAGSPYSYGNGTTPATNIGATTLSKLHADGNQPGYSLDGSDFTVVNSAFQQYNDGVNNILPQPSQLDLNGQIPNVPGSLPYLDYLPQ